MAKKKNFATSENYNNSTGLEASDLEDSDFVVNTDDSFDEGVDAQIFTDKKAEKKLKKKKKTYEHTTLAHKIRVLGVLLVLGIFTGSGLGVWYFNFELRTDFNPFDYIASDYIQDINYTFEKNKISASKKDGLSWVEKAKAQGLTPADLSPSDNYVLAEYNTSLANSYIIDGNGYVDASLATQSIVSRKKYNGSYYTFESISPSAISLISDIILCDKYTGKGNIDLYKSNKLKPLYGDWTYSKSLTPEEYSFESGSLPNTVSAYIVSDKTVLEQSNSKEAIIYNETEGTYTFEMVLDNNTSVINYSKQVKRTGGLGSYPEFHEIIFTATIDGDWNLLSFSIKEEYKAVKGISVTCKGKLDYIVTVNCDVDMPV